MQWSEFDGEHMLDTDPTEARRTVYLVAKTRTVTGRNLPGWTASRYHHGEALQILGNEFESADDAKRAAEAHLK